MVRKGWKPSSEQPAVEPAPPSPAPRRRRRTTAAEPTQTNVERMAAESPRVVAEHRPPGGTHSSVGEDDRTQIRVRLGKRWSQIIVEVKRGDYTWADFVEGLSEEELARGQLKDANGGFVGRPPALVPREFHLACQREMKRRFEEIFSTDVLTLAKMYVELAKDTGIPPEKRAKIIQYAMERIMGGIPKEIQITQEKAWEQVLVNVTADEADEKMPEWRARRFSGYAQRTGEQDEPE